MKLKSPANRRPGGGPTKYLVFLFWIPALIVLYLSIHQEIQAERDRNPHEKPGATAHAGHPH
jgi:hypothetical protein